MITLMILTYLTIAALIVYLLPALFRLVCLLLCLVGALILLGCAGCALFFDWLTTDDEEEDK